jgi:hypothetical protein
MDEIGVALPATSVLRNQPFYPWREPNYILDSDVENIKNAFSKATVETTQMWEWLHAENPTLFHELTISFLREFR